MFDEKNLQRTKINLGSPTLVFADQDGHLYKSDGTQILEFTDSNGFKRAYIDDRHYNLSFLLGKAFYPDSMEIMIGHKDGNRANNQKSNLYWYGNKELEEFEETDNRRFRKPYIIRDAKSGNIINRFSHIDDLCDSMKLTRCCVYQRVASGSNKDGIIIEREGQKPVVRKEPKPRKTTPRPVVQYNPKTNEVIGVYKSVNEASKKSGCNYSSIQGVINGRLSHTGGFSFRLATEDEIKTMTPKKEPIYNIKAVNQYTKDGKFIKTYNTISEASRANGICEGSIRHCLKDRRMTAGGFVWKYADEVKEEDPIITEQVQDTPKEVEVITEQVQEPIMQDTIIEDCIKEEEPKPIEKKKPRGGNKKRPVVQLDRFTGKKIAEFKSIAEASKAVGCDDATIWDVLKGRYQNAKGFKWVYAEDYVEPTEIKEDLTMEDFEDAPTEGLSKEVMTIPEKGDTMQRNDYRMLEVENYKKKKVVCLDPDTRRVLCTFEAISYASKMFNVYLGQIWRALKTGRKLCGYYWEFK